MNLTLDTQPRPNKITSSTIIFYINLTDLSLDKENAINIIKYAVAQILFILTKPKWPSTKYLGLILQDKWQFQYFYEKRYFFHRNVGSVWPKMLIVCCFNGSKAFLVLYLNKKIKNRFKICHICSHLKRMFLCFYGEKDKSHLSCTTSLKMSNKFLTKLG
jgi:hypothetical protein